jgi:hypothetical protein
MTISLILLRLLERMIKKKYLMVVGGTQMQKINIKNKNNLIVIP